MNRSRVLSFALLFVYAVFLSAGSAAAIVPDESESLFQRALSEFDEGKFISARYDFGTLIERYPNSPYLTQSYLLLGKTLYNLHSYSEADSLAVKMRTVFPHTRYSDWTYYLQAACAHRKGKPAVALEILARLAESARDSTVKAASIRALGRDIRPAVDEKQFADSVARHGLVFPSLDIVSAEEKPTGEPLLNEPIQAQTTDMNGPIRIGLLASLTGANSEYGAFLQRGVKAGLAGSDSIDGRPVELLVEDTRSDAVEAVCAVRKLSDKGVLAIIGPEFSSSTITAAIESNARGIPFIAPTATDRDLTRIGSAVYQLNFTPTAEAIALADFAVSALGISNAVIIASRDAWGKDISESFTREMLKNKAQIVRTAFFTPDSEIDDLSAIMRDIRSHAPKPPAFSDSLAAHITNTLSDTATTDSTYYSSRTLAPIRTIGAVLISATPHDAVKIANKLTEYNIIATILGDSGWNDQSVPDDGKRSVEGAFLIAPPGILSGGTGASFLGDTATNDDRQTVAMKGHDAAKLLTHCIREGARDRKALSSSIENIRGFRGSSSYITIDPDTHTNSAVQFIRIINGGFTQVRRDASGGR